MFTLHHGDCLPYLDGLQSETIDGIVTDPPYMDYQTAWYDASEWHKIDPKYFAIAEKRIKQAALSPSLFTPPSRLHADNEQPAALPGFE